MKLKMILTTFLLLTITLGCKKFLDEKPNKNDVIPQNLMDFQALLDNFYHIMPDPGLGEICTDDYYLDEPDWASLIYEEDRRSYTWEKDRLVSFSTQHWFYPYRSIYYSNTILDNLKLIERRNENQVQWDEIKGQALFLRGRSFLSIAGIWAKSYNANTAETDLGIPLRVSSDFNTVSKRASVQETYKQIIEDLSLAIQLLPKNSTHPLRSSKPAALALLGRTYLFMRDYENCFKYVNECLEIKNDLLDYNSLSSTEAYPFSQFNKEVIYASYLPGSEPLLNFKAKINLTLFHSYSNNDLRKTLYFIDNNDGSHSFRGSYDGSLLPFSGIAVDEVYLMRAECYARANKINESMNDLNTLLKHRWDNKVTHIDVTATTTNEALEKILQERRKELLMRGLRWPDIKRLNLEQANISLQRTVGNQIFTLPANDLRFVLPLPEDIIERSSMEQNPK